MTGVEGTDPRRWGFWTRAKLTILAAYLPAFLTASQSIETRVYIDAFAGEGEGEDRTSGERFPGSAEIALIAQAADGSQFTHLRFFEREQRATDLEVRLRARHPGRDIRVYGGDSNERLADALSGLAAVRWAPTFAFLDPDGLEVKWTTLETLAEHKQGSRYKVELWLLFATPGLQRTLSLDPTKVSQLDVERATTLYGTDDWWAIYHQRIRGDIDGGQARDEYLNLMRWRLERELGYRFTHPFLLKREDGIPLYHMVFATDNDAGNRIMTSLYDKLSAELPQLARVATETRSGQLGLELEDPPTGGYVYAAPHDPPVRD